MLLHLDPSVTSYSVCMDQNCTRTPGLPYDVSPTYNPTSIANPIFALLSLLTSKISA
jgi:hypothetical protein